MWAENNNVLSLCIVTCTDIPIRLPYKLLRQIGTYLGKIYIFQYINR
jgi:hypothetical protein